VIRGAGQKGYARRRKYSPAADRLARYLEGVNRVAPIIVSIDRAPSHAPAAAGGTPRARSGRSRVDGRAPTMMLWQLYKMHHPNPVAAAIAAVVSVMVAALIAGIAMVFAEPASGAASSADSGAVPATHLVEN
jgi:hypothetical protein